MLCEVVAPCGGVDNKVPRLHATKPEPLDCHTLYVHLNIGYSILHNMIKKLDGKTFNLASLTQHNVMFYKLRRTKKSKPLWLALLSSQLTKCSDILMLVQILADRTITK